MGFAVPWWRSAEEKQEFERITAGKYEMVHRDSPELRRERPEVIVRNIQAQTCISYLDRNDASYSWLKKLESDIDNKAFDKVDADTDRKTQSLYGKSESKIKGVAK